MLVIRRLIWDSWNVAHIARHAVTPDEVEEVCHGQPMFTETYGGRLRVIGATKVGRLLTVILSLKSQDVYYPVTARSASRKEQHLYNEQKFYE